MKPTLLGYPVSPFVRKVRVALEQKGIDYHLDPVVPYTEREKVLPYNPSGTVPVLLAGEGTTPITESADIVVWAETNMPEPSLIPDDPEQQKRVLSIQHFADTQVAQVFGGMMFGQRLVVPFYFKRDQGKEDLVTEAMNVYAPQILQAITEILGKEDYVAGSFSLADIALSSWIRGGLMVGFQLDKKKWPEINQWLEKCFTQPGYIRVLNDESTLEPVLWAQEKYGI